MDWATLLQRRNDPKLWEAFVTSGPILPDPTLFSPFNPNYAGWWDTPAKRQAWLQPASIEGLRASCSDIGDHA
jgi:peptide/nickel transport system substrate-binding protein